MSTAPMTEVTTLDDWRSVEPRRKTVPVHLEVADNFYWAMLSASHSGDLDAGASPSEVVATLYRFLDDALVEVSRRRPELTIVPVDPPLPPEVEHGIGGDPAAVYVYPEPHVSEAGMPYGHTEIASVSTASPVERAVDAPYPYPPRHD